MNKFQRGDVVENRNGLKARILFVDNVNRLYTIEYINTNSPNHKGQHQHDINGFEEMWEVDRNYRNSNTVETPYGTMNVTEKSSCEQGEHDWKTYIGFNNSFEYCSRCDKKK